MGRFVTAAVDFSSLPFFVSAANKADAMLLASKAALANDAPILSMLCREQRSDL
jgi:hypothetical protein